MKRGKILAVHIPDHLLQDNEFRKLELIKAHVFVTHRKKHFHLSDEDVDLAGYVGYLHLVGFHNIHATLYHEKDFRAFRDFYSLSNFTKLNYLGLNNVKKQPDSKSLSVEKVLRIKCDNGNIESIVEDI